MKRDTAQNIARLIGVTITWGAIAFVIYQDPKQWYILWTGVFITWLLF